MYAVWGVFLQIIAALSGLFAIVSFFYKPDKLKIQTKIIILLCAALVFAVGYIINSQLLPPAMPVSQGEATSPADASSMETSSEPADGLEPASSKDAASSTSSSVPSASLPQPSRPSSSQAQQSAVDGDVSVEITYVPPLGEPNAEEYAVEGIVKGFDSGKHLLFVFVMGVNGDYYVKPYQDAPLSVVDSNGKFKTNVNTDKEGNDINVPSYCAIVVLEKDFPDPQTVTYDEALAYSIASDYKVRK